MLALVADALALELDLLEAAGLGLGKRLLLFVHQCAKELGVGSLILTSAPHRVEANGLYRSLGYEQRNTNAYRLKL